jgi:hypothetical protein
MDAEDVVRNALQVMKDADVPERLEAAALPALIELLGRQQQAGPTPTTALVPYQPEGGLAVSNGHLLERLAGKLALPVDVVEGVYTSDGSTVEISVHPGRLPRSRSTGTKALALLITAMRQAAGDEEFTSVNEIRRIAQEYDRYDGPNFASAINEMRGSFLVKGTARQRQLKLTRPGWQQAADLVRELGEGQVR